MENHVPFKVFTYWTEGGKPEIRRFGVDRTLVTSFLYLNAKIQETFPGLKTKNYSVTWTDDEGDDVTISTDDEIMMALVATNSTSVKLNVFCKEDNKEKDDNGDDDIVFATVSDAAHHFGVTCDSCDREVYGFRYKCTTCDDYDLCSKCESAGTHPNHCMVRVPVPTMPRAVIKAAIKKSRHFLKTVAGNSGEGECPFKKNKRERSGERKHHGHDHHERHHRRSRTNWFETFATYMNEFANLAGDVDLDVQRNPQKNDRKSQDQAQPETQGQKETQGQQENQGQQEEAQVQRETRSQEPIQEAQQQKSTENTESPKPTIPTLAFPECLLAPNANGNVQVLQKLIEMFVSGNSDLVQPQPSTSVSNNSHSNNASVNTNNVETSNASVNTTDVEMGQGDRAKADSGDKASSSGSSASSVVTRDESPDKADDWTVINKEKDLMDAYTKAPSAPAEPAAPIGFNLPQEFQERVNIAETSNLYPPLNAATAVMNPKEAERVPPTPQAAAAPQPVHKNIKYHANPKIDQATKQMLAMGFTNEGGWLTQLLASKDGNIVAVLDLLTPVRQRK